MKLDKRVSEILERAFGGVSPGKEDCVYLLTFPQASPEAAAIRTAADTLLRRKSENSAIILGQIGVEVSGCEGNCRFCSFGKDHTHFKSSKMDDEELERQVHSFCDGGDLYGLYLLTMHDYDLEHLLHAVALSKRIAPPTTQIWVNVGDTEREAFVEMKKAGVTGVYHVCRIGEGMDTSLDPKQRVRTMHNALDAGLELYTCCEPIGPEHTPEQLVENMFIGIDMGITQHAAMRRVAVEGTPLAVHGQISDLRLAQIAAVVALASFNVKTMMYMGIHEPNLLGYISGANIITAESGVNPRDLHEETSQGRGMDLAACRRMLFECGFDYIRRGDESKIPLTFDYLRQTKSV